MASAGSYDAFISYSHRMDGQLAPALRSGLEQLAKPWRQRRALRVFHDASGLGVTAGLWSTIAAALDRTRYFLLLASPAAALSPWVQQEVGYFRARRGAEAIFLVLTDGECRWDPVRGDFDWPYSTAVPVQLSRGYREEPLFIDLRWARSEEQLDLRHSRFRQAVADLAAPIRGVPRDEIDLLDLREFRAARRARRLATTALAALTVASLVGGTGAVVNAQRARAQERLADSGRLAALSVGYAAERTDLALLLARHSLQRADTREGRLALATAMTRPAAAYGPLPGTDLIGQALAAGPLHSVAAGSPTGRVAVWAQDGPVTPRDFPGHTQSISELAFAPDETALASVDVAGSLVVHDVASGTVLRQATGVADAVFLADGSLVTTGLDGSVVASDRSRQRIRWTTRGVSPRSRTGADRAALAASADGRWVAVATADARIVLLAADSGAVLAAWRTGGSDANDVVFAPTSTALLAAGDDGVARIWRLPGHTLVAELGGPLSGVRRVAWSADGTTVATGGFDARARLYDTGAQRLIGELVGHAWAVGGLSYGADQQTLWTGDHDGIRTWNLTTGRPDRVVDRDEFTVTAARFSADGSVLATQSAGGLTLWRPAQDFARVVKVQGGLDVALSPDGRTAVSVGVGGRARRYATDDGRLLAEDGAGAARLWGVDASPDGQTYATVDEKGTVSVRDLADGRLRWEAALLSDGYDVAYTADGRGVVVIGQQDPTVVLADAVSGAVQGRWKAPPGTLPSAIAVTPDGAQIVVGRSDGRLTVLAPAALRPIRDVLAHQNRIYAVAVSPDSSLVATGAFNGGGISQGGFDPGLRLWDAATGQQVGQLVAHDRQVEAVSFSPDNRWLVSGGADRQVLLWPSVEGWRERACAVAQRDLNAAERELLLSPGDPASTVC